MSKHDYKIELTHGAKAWCAAHAWPQALTARVRGEIAGEMQNGLKSVNSLCFHSFEWSRDDPQEFICTPAGDNVLRVDTCSREEVSKLTAGPFKGKTVVMPVPDEE